jgi:nicotinate-nucleotide adenylyltransferase
LCRFIATTRPDFDLEEAKHNLSASQRDRITWLEVPGLHIASRELRRRVNERQTIRYLTPDSVAEEIEKRGLYRSE